MCWFHYKLNTLICKYHSCFTSSIDHSKPEIKADISRFQQYTQFRAYLRNSSRFSPQTPPSAPKQLPNAHVVPIQYSFASCGLWSTCTDATTLSLCEEQNSAQITKCQGCAIVHWLACQTLTAHCPRDTSLNLTSDGKSCFFVALWHGGGGQHSAGYTPPMWTYRHSKPTFELSSAVAIKKVMLHGQNMVAVADIKLKTVKALRLVHHKFFTRCLACGLHKWSIAHIKNSSCKSPPPEGSQGKTLLYYILSPRTKDGDVL